MILRNLQGGWQFQPAWRAATVAELLKKIAPEEDPIAFLRGEEDEHIRQCFLLQKTGQCLEQEAYEYARCCHENRHANSAVAVIKSMTIARQSPKAIAARMATNMKNIVLYQRLFFDVRRYLDQREWIAACVLPQGKINSMDPVAVREQALMSVAFHRGWRGLKLALTGSLPTDEVELEELTDTVKAALKVKAHEFVIQNMNSQASADDLGRFMDFMRLPQSGNRREQHEKVQRWGESIRELFMKKIDANKKSAELQKQDGTTQNAPVPSCPVA